MTATVGAPGADGELDRLEEAARRLEAAIEGEVRFDDGARALYSTDASSYRQVPLGVVVPKTIDDAVEAIRVCHEMKLPITSRGGGTSLAGQCTNEAVVIDFSKYCNRVLSIDVENRRCVVEPGIVLDQLNEELKPHGLRYGPEPATHPNCTLGGMIGNNSCGATAQRTGKVVDNIASLDVMLHDGTRFTARQLDDDEYAEVVAQGGRVAEIHRALRDLRDRHGDLIRERYPQIPRRVSGYNIDSLLPEYGFDIAGALVGSEGTLVTVLSAELELVPVEPYKTLVVLGYRDIATAADAVPRIVEHDPIAIEAVDKYLVKDQELKDMNGAAIEELPEGTGFLMVQFGADSAEEATRQAEEMLDALGTSDHAANVAFYDDPEREHELWLVRESGLGATAHPPHRRDTFEGWEDSAVPVDRLGDYLRDLRDLFGEFGYQGDAGPSLYGHFGQGCVHTRIPFDLFNAEGVADYRTFLERAADLVASYGGSFSGEHGDGQARGELLPKMFGNEVVGLFEQVKGLFDPDNLMNPGKVVHPAPLDSHLRLGGSWAPRQPLPLYFGYTEEEGSFTKAANRCVGVGKCRGLSNQGGSVMCPSYHATREEKHSTRGRARLLFEMLEGHPDSPITDGWRSEEVREALDLCLACKGCKSDCPANVDMATYKAEFLAHHYKGRLRPRADYATGWLPVMARMVERLGLADVVNRLGERPLLRKLATRAAGLEDRRLPTFATTSAQRWWQERRRQPSAAKPRGRVLLWPDTFSNRFHPQVAQAAVRVLEDAGWEVEMPTEDVCCGLTWISTGQLDQAKRRLRRTIDVLAPHVREGGFVLGLEPSCATVFRSDAAELFPSDLDVDRLRDHTVTFAELLMKHTPDWTPPRVPEGDRLRAVVQVHCHQHAVLGWDTDRELLEAMGVEVERLDSGCCGLAGNFGFTAGHGEVSEACAEEVLLPRLREIDPDDPETTVLADGFSCRTQIADLAEGHQSEHLAELVARLLDRQ